MKRFNSPRALPAVAGIGRVPIHVPLKVDAHQWQARKDAYAMRQLSFFRCWYFFSLMSAEAAEADAVRYAALVPAEVGTCASQANERVSAPLVT